MISLCVAALGRHGFWHINLVEGLVTNVSFQEGCLVFEHRRIIASALISLAIVGSAAAQSSPPTYQGDPDVYKVIFENDDFRVISATWKKGANDKSHSHPVAFVVYPVTDCTIRLHNPDGSTRVNEAKAGTPFAGPVVPSHTAENISDHDCQAIFVERK
jgi:hypothetical protein